MAALQYFLRASSIAEQNACFCNHDEDYHNDNADKDDEDQYLSISNGYLNDDDDDNDD